MKKLLLSLLFCSVAHAQSPLILKANDNLKTNQLFDVAVRIRHPDTGWNHYVNEWIVVTADGKEIAKRTLYHPHVNEQPFTRYVKDVVIHVDVSRVTITAKCNKGHQSEPYILINRKNKQ
jgi:hypothetical protein